MRKIYFLAVALVFSFSSIGQIQMTSSGSYTQDFNTLPSSGSITWIDNSTISNWFAQRTGTGTSIAADVGTSTAGNLYSYGSSGNIDRALGSLGSGGAGAGHFAWGVLLYNNSGAPVSSITVSYTGEQWRNSAAAAQTVGFHYQVAPTVINDLTPNVHTGWTAVTALDFTSPITGGTAGALNGNLAANRTVVSSTFSVTLQPGEYVMLRWNDPDHTGSDHGLAIDDVSIEWIVNSTPTPTITVTPSSLPTFIASSGSPSAEQTYTVNGSNLNNNNITITAPAGFEISTSSGSGFTSNLTLTPTAGSVSTTTIYVRMNSTTVGSISGNISHTSTGATTQNVAVTGTNYAAPVPFTPGNLVIYRVGDGSASLSNASTMIFLDEYTPTGNLVQSVLLPTTVSGMNRRITASGNATSEGLITRSTNGAFLIFTGYDVDLGTPNIPSSLGSTINRIVGTISSNGTINTTTALSDFASGDNPRSATSTNGTDLWITGAAGGVRYTTLGATSSTQLTTSSTATLRQVDIFNDQLYVTGSSTAGRLSTVGTGLPTTSGQATTTLPNLPTTGSSSYSFFFADLEPSVPGVDVLYIAEDGLGGAGSLPAGLYKYSLVGGDWVSNGSIAYSSLRGLTGLVSGNTITLFGTSHANFVSLSDASGYNATITGTPTLLATASNFTAFRGIAFTPEGAVGAPLPVRFTNIKATERSGNVLVEFTNATETDVVKYEVERSDDGRTFTQIGTLTPAKNDGSSATYQFTDVRPLAGNAFYRIKATEVDGKITFSSIARINTKATGTDLVLYPNPVKGSDISLQISNLPEGVYRINIINSNGQIISTRSFSHRGGAISESINITAANAGIYTLQVTGPVSLQKQFIKQ